jgi:hypothetical protein
MRAMSPEQAGWTTTSMLLAELVDTVHWLQWTKTRDGQRGRNMPARVPRPGTRVKPRPGLKPKALPLSQVKKQLAQPVNPPDRIAALKQIFDGR